MKTYLQKRLAGANTNQSEALFNDSVTTNVDKAVELFQKGHSAGYCLRVCDITDHVDVQRFYDTIARANNMWK